jgi:hypothetical protein
VRDLLGRFLDSPFVSPLEKTSKSIGGGSLPFLDPLAFVDTFSPKFFITVRGVYCFCLVYAWKQRVYGSGFYSGFF